jgi:hypothetical protein
MPSFSMCSFIKTCVWLGTFWLAAGLAVFAADLPAEIEGGSNAVATNLTANFLLARVRECIPKEKLLIKGQLRRGTRIGRLEQAFRLELLLELGQKPPTASYTLSDTFGKPIARLTVTRPPDKAAELGYEQGQPIKPAPLPDLNQPIENTELTWNDLSLAFLWWPNGTVVGRDNIRGRDCYVVEVPVPPREQPEGKPSAKPLPSQDKPPPGSNTVPQAEAPGGVSSVRLWIDDHLIVLIQIEEYDAGNKLLRKLSVKNFKKIGDLWMIKNLDVKRYPTQHRTQIRVDEVIRASATNAAPLNLSLTNEPDLELPLTE